MGRKLIIGLALSSLLLGGCSNKSGQLKGLNSTLQVYYSNRIDYYTNGEYSVIHYWYKTGELTIKEIENAPQGKPNHVKALYTYVGDFEWVIKSWELN